MSSFQILLTDQYDVNKILLEAVHSDVLTGRTGYIADFLGKEVALPELSDALKQDRAEVLQDSGPNGKYVLDYTHFSVVYNKLLKLPFYTAVNMIGKTNLMGLVHEQRSGDAWYQDYRIEEGGNSFQFGNSDYLHKRFDKGHMVRYYDPAWDSEDIAKIAMGDTFHYTNCCPQIHYFNGIVWNFLEDYCMARNIFQDNKLTVFSGPIFNKAQDIDGLLVPLNFWKVIVYQKDDGLGALGFLMSQEKYLQKPEVQQLILEELKGNVQPKLKKSDIERLFSKQELITAQIKISLIEEKTGISFGLNDVDDYKDNDKYYHEILLGDKSQMGLKYVYEELFRDEWKTFLEEL